MGRETRSIARVTVADDGPGIPADLVEQVFDRYVTSGDRGGTGLGLPIVRRVIEHHGGTAVLRAGDDGTTVVVDLPLGTVPHTDDEPPRHPG